MKKIVIASVLVGVVLIGIIFGYVGDIIGGDTVNILTLIGAIAILGLTIGVGLKYVNQIKNDKASGVLAEENWDGIGEYKNPLPVGWAVSFIGVIVFFIYYLLVGYPVWAYSQIGEYNEEVKAYNEKFEAKHKNMSHDELKAMGESIFLVNCAPCHGVTADGMDGKAADLTKRIDYKSVLYVLEHGSNNGFMGEGVSMPSYSWLPAEDKKAVAKYVAHGFNDKKYPKGKEVYDANCQACHGADGRGTPFVAPNIREFTPDLVQAVLEHGKKGHIGTMPSFRVEDMRFTEIQQKAVGIYVSELAE
jgi:cytochrome c oxidase cbb3-type subunit 3